MTDEEGLKNLKKSSRASLITIFLFLLSGVTCLFIVGGTFTTASDVLNKMYPDRYYIIVATILTPLFYLAGWGSLIYGRRFGKMMPILIVALCSIPPFILFYLLWGLSACLSMVNS